MLFIHKTFLAYKFETLKNCKKLKPIMIMIIPIIYIFSSYVIFDQQLKITLISKPFSWKTLSLPPWKKYTPPFLLTTLKIQKVQVPSFCQHWKFFSPPPPPAERGRKDNMSHMKVPVFLLTLHCTAKFINKWSYFCIKRRNIYFQKFKTDELNISKAKKL